MTHFITYVGVAAALLLMLICSHGCATATITTKHVDGKQVECSANFSSLFVSLDSVASSACGGKSAVQGQKVDAQLAAELIKVLVGMP